MMRIAIVLATVVLAGCGAAGSESFPFLADRWDAAPAVAPPPKEPNWSDGLDLDEALSLAAGRNPRQRVIRHEFDLARAQRVTAGTYPYNPELAVDGSRAFPLSGAEDYAVRLGLRQTFEIAGQRGYRIAAADANVDRSRWFVADAARVLRGQTTIFFYEVLFLQRREALSAQVLESARRFQETAEARLRAQQIPELEVNLVRVQLQRAQIDSERTRRELVRARARLSALLGEPSKLDYEVRGDLAVALVVLDAERLSKLAQDRRPDLKALRAAEESARQRVKLAEASAWPDPTVGVFGERGVSRFEAGSAPRTSVADRDNVVGIELSIGLPLLNARRGEILEARVEERRASSEILAITQEIRRDLELGVQRLALAKATLDLYEKELNRLSKQNLGDVERAYRAGQVGTLEFLRAQEDFTRSGLAYLEAQFELRVSLAELEAAVGAPASELK